MQLPRSLPLSLLALCSSLAAQYPNISGYRLYHTVPWETEEPSGQFRVIQAGKLRSSTPRDVVALRGSELHLLANMAGRDYPELLLDGVTGMVLLPDFGAPLPSDGKLDALLVLTSSGAALWSWDGSQFTSTSLPQLVGWAGAGELKRGPGGTLFARSAAGNAILCATYGQGSLVAAATLPVTGSIQDYEPMFWNEDAVVDLAVIAGGQIVVRSTTSWSGSLVPMDLAAGPKDLLAVSHGTAGERDLLVLYSELGGTGFLTAANSARMDPTFALYTTLAGLESFAFDRVGGAVAREDLFLSLATSRDVVQFQRLAPQAPGNPSFWLPTASGVALSYVIENDGELTTVPTQGTRTFGHDVDGDGDQDVLLGLSNPNELQVLLNERLERFEVVCPDIQPKGVIAGDSPTYFPMEGSFDFQRRNETATHLRLEVRCQPGIGYDPGHKAYWVQLLQSSSPGTVDLPFSEVPASDSNYDFTITGAALGAGGEFTRDLSVLDVLQLTFYELQKDNQGTVIEQFPPVTYFYSLSDAVEQAFLSLPEIGQYHPEVPTGPVAQFAIGSGGTVIGGRGLGGP